MFFDVAREYSASLPFNSYAYTHSPRLFQADKTGGTFQLRPHKDFLLGKGRDRLLSLRMLSELVTYNAEESVLSDPNSDPEPRNAYDFMKKRKRVNGDPTTQRWNASVRLANYASLESSPLCVCVPPS